MIVRSPLSCRFLKRSGSANENGAAAPETPTAAAPTPAFFSRSRLLSLPADIETLLLSSALAERSAGEAGDESVQERVVDQGQRNARDQDRAHDPGPVEEVAANQVGGNADGQG